MKKLFVCLTSLFLFFVTFAQVYIGSQCHCCDNDTKRIKKFLKGEIETIQLDYAMTGSWANWQTSFLPPYGTEPAHPEHNPSAPDFGDEWIEYDKWTCMFTAQSIHDQDTKTAWAENVKGYGAGEVVIAFIGMEPVSPEIWAGFGYNETLFKQNNRPKNVNVYLLAGKPNAHQNGTMISDIWIASGNQVTLEDKNGYQPLEIAYISTQVKEGIVYLVAVEIIDVYKGSKYDDTCITEIKAK
jgi:hypothetical protein